MTRVQPVATTIPRTGSGRRLALTVTALLVLAACGSSADGTTTGRVEPEALIPTTTTTTTTTVPPTTTTTVPPTTTTTTTVPPTTTTTTTTVPPTTLPPAGDLPTPAPVPPARSAEPRIELGRIEIPKLGVNELLLQGISMRTLDQGPGHWPGTAVPGGWGNTVIAGHRTSHSKPFRHIDQLVPGDEIIYRTGDGVFVYRVTGTQIVNPTDVWIVNQNPGRTTTLFACHPPGSTRQRIVVFGELIT